MQRPERARHIGIDAMRSMQRSEWQIAANKIYSTQGENMIIPALPEAVHIRRSAHGFTHSFSHLQMDAYGRECAALATKEIRGQQAVLIDLLRECLSVLGTIDGDNSDEIERLADLELKCEKAIEGALQ